MAMTIEELMAEARRYAKMSTNDTATIAMRGTYAQIAQACAQTAQAMILAQMTTTGENVTTGETVRWLRVDTGN